MSEWIVYGKDGQTEKCRLKSVEYSGSFLNERAVSATIENHSKIQFEVFDYIEYRGEKFELESIPTVKKTSSFSYEYELRFVSYKYELERCEMRDIVPNDNRVVYPTPLTFSFTGDVRYLVERIQACLDELYGKDVWKLSVADDVVSEEKNITIAQQNCWNALSLVNTTYELNFYIKGRNITIGGSQPILNHTFQYGKGNGLYEIERTSDTDTAIVTKLRAYGSERNLDYSYPKKPEWSDSALDTSFVLSPLRLMLPSFKKDGKTDYILADEATIAEYGIREASVIYDDIYPTITGVKNLQGQAIDEIKAVEAVDDTKSTFVIHLHDLGFDLESHLTTADAQISMKSGAMQGYTFNISAIEKQEDNSYKITLGRITTDTSDTGNYEIPNSSWNMAAGDKFVLLNILIPQEYIREAENRLLERAKEYLAEYGKTNFSYNVGLHDKFLVENSDVYSSLVEGAKLTIHDEVLGISEDVTIQSITITENAEDNILPQVKITLNNNPSASTLDRIQGQIKELSETASGNFSSQSELLKQYRKKLDKPFFDRLFVAVGLDGKELASTDTTSPIAYIKAKYSFATIGGITMYAQDGNMDIPTIAEGLPFDNRTIWFNTTTKQIEVIGGTGGGSGEGVSNFWDLNGIPSWITNTKPTYNYSEIKNTPDLSIYALKSAIPSLDGYATEQWVLGKGYALSSDLSKYIPISGTTKITGEKDFTGGLKVNGSPIVYDSRGFWKLEGDLLVTGGVTMYGNDSEFVASTIMDAILYDNSTLGINAQGQLYVKGGTGGGGISSVTSQMIVDALGYTPASATALSGYLPLTGGQLSGTLTVSNGSQWTPIKINRAEWGESTFVVDSSGLYISHTIDSVQAYLQLHPNNGFKFNGNTIWHSGNFTPSNYLPLSGGTIKSTAVPQLTLQGESTDAYITYKTTLNTADSVHSGLVNLPNIGASASFGVSDRIVFPFSGGMYYRNGYNGTNQTIWHAGNDGSGSGLDADMLDGKHLRDIIRYEGRNDNGNDAASAQTITYWGEGNRGHGYTYGTSLNIQGAESWNHRIDFRTDGVLDYYQGINTGAMTHIGTIAFTSSNVASATKLATARTIWGQSFNGTGDIGNKSGSDASSIHIVDNRNDGVGGYQAIRFYYNTDNQATIHYFHNNFNGLAWTSKNINIDTDHITFGNWNSPTMIINRSNGNVGIGTTNPGEKLQVNGNISTSQGFLQSWVNCNGSTGGYLRLVGYYSQQDQWTATIASDFYGQQWCTTGGFTHGMIFKSGRSGFDNFIFIDSNGNPVARLCTTSGAGHHHFVGDMLVTGGITMYSARKLKNIQDERGLSLEELSVIKPTRFTWKDGRDNKIHIGGIADDVMKVLPEVIYKADNDTLTMDYGNAAFAIAASLIKPVVNHEERIRLLEEENKRLKEEVEQLKWNIA